MTFLQVLLLATTPGDPKGGCCANILVDKGFFTCESMSILLHGFGDQGRRHLLCRSEAPTMVKC